MTPKKDELHRYPLLDGQIRDPFKTPLLLSSRYFAVGGVSSDELDLVLHIPALALRTVLNAVGYRQSYVHALSTETEVAVAVDTPFPGIREVWTLDRRTNLPLRVSVQDANSRARWIITFKTWRTIDGLVTPSRVELDGTRGDHQQYNFEP
ncbi:MAG: hypothetical protein JF563_02030, partial [Acidobacteriales bacterium]|nr:hypothetical protein [Terriglobales bacterium]